ncbi:MAG: diguanylate cyclase, partial [Desulfuromonadaceae bacterium]|nr:diguanylate cyclase [Desulfuromonadaceae bacterium]
MPHKVWPKPFRHLGTVRVFFISLSVILALVDILVAYFLCDRADKLLLLQVREQALAYADLIENTRIWNADY